MEENGGKLVSILIEHLIILEKNRRILNINETNIELNIINTSHFKLWFNTLD